jgi:hypothetical protein
MDDSCLGPISSLPYISFYTAHTIINSFSFYSRPGKNVLKTLTALCPTFRVKISNVPQHADEEPWLFHWESHPLQLSPLCRPGVTTQTCSTLLRLSCPGTTQSRSSGYQLAHHRATSKLNISHMMSRKCCEVLRWVHTLRPDFFPAGLEQVVYRRDNCLTRCGYCVEE